MKFILLSLVFFIFFFVGSSCRKKINKHPFDIYGVWTCNHYPCSSMNLEIKRDGSGSYKNGPGGKGCSRSEEGKIRFTKSALFVGGMKLKFVSKPEELPVGDSLSLSYMNNDTVRVFAKMTLEETKIQSGKTYTLYKVINY